MKKLICTVLVLMIILSLCACGGDSRENNETKPANQQTDDTHTSNQSEKPTASSAEGGHIFTYNGTEISMHAPAADILASLGQAKSQTEEASCAFEGMDKTYNYGSFFLQTYPLEEQDYIYCLWFMDDTVTTAEGIYIGSSEEQVKQAYGEDTYNGSNAYIITKGESILTIITDAGAVTGITYDAVVS